MSVAAAIPARAIERSWHFWGPENGGPETACIHGRLLRRRADRAVDQDGREYPLRTESGLCFLWFDPDGEAPDFHIPLPDPRGWTPMTFEHLDLRTQPRIIMQDLADVMHFETVHRYARVKVVEPLKARGAQLSTTIAFHWDTGIPGVLTPASFESEVWGMGYQRTEVSFFGGTVQSRHLVMPVPLSPELTRVYLGLSIRIRARLVPPGLRTVADRLMHAFVGRSYRRDIGRDAALWIGQPPPEHELPAMDPSLARFRAWSLQFTSSERFACPS